MTEDGITVIVVGWQGDAWLPECLRSLVDASQRRLKLVIVDNFDNPCLKTLDLREFDLSIVVPPYPMGFAEANNFALVQESPLSGVVVLLNQDTNGVPGWIDVCMDLLLKMPELGVVGPVLRTLDDSAYDVGYLECVRGVDTSGTPCFAVPQVSAAAMLIRASVLREVGPFDAIFGSYYEDFDLCARVRRAGHVIGVCPDAKVLHYGGSASDSKAGERRRMRWIVKNRVIHKVRSGEGRRIGALARHLLLDFPRNVIRGLFRTASSQPVLVTLGAHLDLLPVLRRLISKREDEAAWHRQLLQLGWVVRERGGSPEAGVPSS